MKVIPVASAWARTRCRQIELAMEIQAAAAHQLEIDAAGDRVRRARWHFVRRIHEELRAAIGATFVCKLFTALTARLHREDRLDELEDRDRTRIAAAAYELAGLLEATTA